MRWSVAKAVTIGLVLLSNTAVSQSPAVESLILSTGCGRFHLVLGRVKLDCFHYKKVRLHQASEESNDQEEFVCVTANRGIPSLHYLRQLGPTRITIDTVESDAVRIEAKTQHRSGVEESFLIQQPVDGPIQIVHAFGSRKQQFEADSFWHLLADEPTLFKQQVGPLLSLMIDRCRLERSAQVIEQRLLSQAVAEPLITKRLVDQWVAQLASPVRRERVVAQGELASAGVGILPLLNQIDFELLDAEQQQRIRKLKQHLMVDRSDTPDRVAAWLSTDRHYWGSISRHWPSQQRSDANRFLLATCGEGLGAGGSAIALKPDRQLR